MRILHNCAKSLGLNTLLSVVLLTCSFAAEAEVYSCICDGDAVNPTFEIRADRSTYLLELSLYDDFSLATPILVTVPASGVAETTLNGPDYPHGTYYWRYRGCSYSQTQAYYSAYSDQRTVTFGSNTVDYTPTVSDPECVDIAMPDGTTYSLQQLWVRSHVSGNHWIDTEPHKWVVNDLDDELTSEHPVHGAVVRNGIIYTPVGGGKFNSAWIVDGRGLCLNRMSLLTGVSLPPLRITAPDEHPFRTTADGAYAGAMYQIGEDADGTVYFTTTTDIANNNTQQPIAIRVYAIDLNTSAAVQPATAAIEARFVEELTFPSTVAKHSRHHQVVVEGSLAGAHRLWTVGTNTGCDAMKTRPVITVYRWTVMTATAEPQFEQSVISDIYIGGYNASRDYITIATQQLLPVADSNRFYYHATFYDNGDDPYLYYQSCPALYEFTSGGNCTDVDELRDAAGYDMTSPVAAAGVSLTRVGDNALLAYGTTNPAGASTITLAHAGAGDNMLSGSAPVAMLNTQGFSMRHRQSVNVQALPGHLLVHAGNGGMALYDFHDQTTTALDINHCDSDIVAVRYYDVYGREVNANSAAGILIRSTLRSDGSVTTSKSLQIH